MVRLKKVGANKQFTITLQRLDCFFQPFVILSRHSFGFQNPLEAQGFGLLFPFLRDTTQIQSVLAPWNAGFWFTPWEKYQRYKSPGALRKKGLAGERRCNSYWKHEGSSSHRHVSFPGVYITNFTFLEAPLEFFLFFFSKEAMQSAGIASLTTFCYSAMAATKKLQFEAWRQRIGNFKFHFRGKKRYTGESTPCYLAARGDRPG